MNLSIYTITAQPEGEDMAQLQPQTSLEAAKEICQKFQNDNDWDHLGTGEESQNIVEFWHTVPEMWWWENTNFLTTLVHYTISKWELELEVRIK